MNEREREEYDRKMRRVQNATHALSSGIPATVDHFRTLYTEQIEAVIDCLDDSNVCEECGKSSRECARHGMYRNMELAIERLRALGWK